MTTFWKSPLVVLALSLTFYGFSSAAEGIYVQPAKYFDERSLTIMLDDLERQLAAVQVIDQSKLDAQLGVSSGTTRRAFGFSVNVGGPALPGIITKSTLNSAGVLAPSEQTVTQAAATPTAPTSPTVNALAGAPAPGINSEAMLSEQINLTYRLYSLRTLLNRSISDRLYVKDPKAVKNGEKFVTGTRKQVLLGFSIDVQPPKNSEEKEAYVRIDINPMGGRLPSVVSLMPQEKTFNVATVSEKANSFGFAIPISVITVGLSVGSQSQALFVYRDTDTVGRLDSPIRPVLGRKWVEPGNRKVFVTLSLDSEDNPSAVEELSYTVTTGWRKLKDRMAIDQAVESGPAEIGTVLIYGEKVVRGTLEPQISKAMISPLSATNALVTFEGKNFFPGTRLAIGDSLISESGPALTIPSDEALTFSAKLTDLESGFASVYGRYGLPVPVKADPKSNYKLGFRLSLLASPDPGRDLVPVQLGLRECADRQLQTSCTTPTWIRDENITLLVSAGSQQQLISGQTMYESCVELPDKSKPCFLTTDIEVTKDSLNKEQKISISVPFAGPAFRDTRGLQNPLSFNKLVKLGGALGRLRILVAAGRWNKSVLSIWHQVHRRRSEFHT